MSTTNYTIRIEQELRDRAFACWNITASRRPRPSNFS